MEKVCNQYLKEWVEELDDGFPSPALVETLVRYDAECKVLDETEHKMLEDLLKLAKQEAVYGRLFGKLIDGIEDGFCY